MNVQTARVTTAEAALLRHDDGPVAVLTLNRPAARNSLSEQLLVMLGDALTAIAANQDVRAGLANGEKSLRGTGGFSRTFARFCALNSQLSTLTRSF